jgi:hypothetical protein
MSDPQMIELLGDAGIAIGHSKMLLWRLQARAERLEAKLARIRSRELTRNAELAIRRTQKLLARHPTVPTDRSTPSLMKQAAAMRGEFRG